MLKGQGVEEGNRKRRRGIRASQARLTHAMSDAGLQTQAALADRIADLEELESTPRDMVSRCFRELPVEARSIDRIARALGVEAHTLYKMPDEPGLLSDDLKTETVFANGWKYKFIIPATVVLIAIGWLTYAIIGQMTEGPGDLLLSMGDQHVVVVPIDGDTANTLARQLRAALASEFNVTSGTAVTTPPPYDLTALAQRLRTDVILETELATSRRLLGIRVFAFHKGVRQQIWAESLPRIALGEQKSAVAENIIHALRYFLGGESILSNFPLADVQDDYLLGEFYLDEPSNELTLKRAETRFTAALRHDPTYAKAHAGLCQTLLEAHWMLEEDRMLEDARTACNQALLLAPDDIVVKIAQAHFLRRTGRNDEALVLYQEIIDQNPDYPSAYTGLASSWLDVYRQNADGAALQSSIAANQKAADLDPLLWKPLFNLAANQWFASDIDGAIAASEAALQRQENEYILGNLGTFYMCVGNFANARTAYERAKEIAPQSYIGSEFLSVVSYFLGDYDEAIRLRRQAIDSIGTGTPEIHEMWGNLGDAYRHGGDIENAVTAYQQAADIAERDYLRGTIPVADQAARAYYYTVLRQLDPSKVTDSVYQEITQSLDQISDAQFEATPHRRMAQTWVLRGNLDRARKSFAAATEKCPGYGLVPDLKHLAETSQ